MRLARYKFAATSARLIPSGHTRSIFSYVFRLIIGLIMWKMVLERLWIVELKKLRFLTCIRIDKMELI